MDLIRLIAMLNAPRKLDDATRRQFHQELRNGVGFGGLRPIWRLFVD